MKSLEERQAERQERQEQAEAQKAEARAILATGTLAEGNTGESEESDYSSWTVAELKAELDNREIEYAASAKKAELIEALETNDAEE